MHSGPHLTCFSLHVRVICFDIFPRPARWVIESASWVQLHGLSNEVAKLEAQAQDRTLSPRDAHILDELLTGMLEKIDAVDTMGRANLRMVRNVIVRGCVCVGGGVMIMVTRRCVVTILLRGVCSQTRKKLVLRAQAASEAAAANRAPK